MNIGLKVPSGMKCSAKASKFPRKDWSQAGSMATTYLSKQASATARADGKLLGAAIESPAPQTIISRPASIDPTSLASSSGFNSEDFLGSLILYL